MPMQEVPPAPNLLETSFGAAILEEKQGIKKSNQEDYAGREDLQQGDMQRNLDRDLDPYYLDDHERGQGPSNMIGATGFLNAVPTGPSGDVSCSPQKPVGKHTREIKYKLYGTEPPLKWTRGGLGEGKKRRLNEPLYGSIDGRGVFYESLLRNIDDMRARHECYKAEVVQNLTQLRNAATEQAQEKVRKARAAERAQQISRKRVLEEQCNFGLDFGPKTLNNDTA
ncbi:unnamed protein product, partial [Amoebophrya sp. A25]|eukprot:GSA25T00011566001.1